ncbi:MAG: SRPBCC family protein [Steroidobacteraceae bacterium]
MSAHAGSIHAHTQAPVPLGLEEDHYSVSPWDRNDGASARTQMQRARSNEQLVLGLGWFSIALGITQLLAPRQLARVIGVEENTAVMLTLAVRELASGIAILAAPDTTATALKARVAGDAMDLALLGAATLRGDSQQRSRAIAAALAVAGVTALDVLATRRYEEAASAEVVIDIRKSIAINMPADQLYHAWRDFESLPTIMHHLESVTVLENGRSRWVARAPAHLRVEWEAEEIANEPNQLLAWRSVPGSQIENMGSVRFEPLPGRRGTLLTVELEYRPPGGKLGAGIAKLFGEEPATQLQDDLRRFKQLMETGEIATTRSQPSGRRSLKYRLMSKKEPANAR